MRGARARTQMHAASTQGTRQHTEGSKVADASVARWCCGRRKEKRMVRRGDRAEHEGEVGIPMEGESATAHARRKKPAPDGGSRRRRQQTRRQQNGTAPNPTHPTLSYAPHGSSFRPCVGLTTLTSPRSMQAHLHVRLCMLHVVRNEAQPSRSTSAVFYSVSGSRARQPPTKYFLLRRHTGG